MRNMRNEISEILDYFDMEVTALTDKEKTKMAEFIEEKYEVKGR
jgi:hypothetical protein